MNLVRLDSLFEVNYGHSLELNRLDEVSKDTPNSVNFVSRTRENNGVSAIVELLPDVEPIEAGTISVAGSGNSILYSFLQPEPYYSGYHLFYLKAKADMTDKQKLFYCYCIMKNRFKYSYGRQANRTLPTLLVPALDEIPAWVNDFDVQVFDGVDEPYEVGLTPELKTEDWQSFKYSELFEIERGKGSRKKDLDGTGETPVVTSSDKNNGWTGFTIESPCHNGGTIGVNRNGSIGEAFYQPIDFCSTEDVHIFTPKFEMNIYIAMFLCCLIRIEKYRFNYGRKWGIARMKESIIKLPVKSTGEPDWDFMENYIKSLPYSKSIET